MKEGLESFLLELLLLILKEIFFLISAVFGLFVEFSMGIYMRGNCFTQGVFQIKQSQCEGR